MPPVPARPVKPATQDLDRWLIHSLGRMQLKSVVRSISSHVRGLIAISLGAFVPAHFVSIDFESARSVNSDLDPSSRDADDLDANVVAHVK
jgi:hypothetical protein